MISHVIALESLVGIDIYGIYYVYIYISDGRYVREKIARGKT